MITFSDEEEIVLKALVLRLALSFIDPIFVEGHRYYTDLHKRDLFLHKLGIHFPDPLQMEEEVWYPLLSPNFGSDP